MMTLNTITTTTTTTYYHHGGEVEIGDVVCCRVRARRRGINTFRTI